MFGQNQIYMSGIHKNKNKIKHNFKQKQQNSFCFQNKPSHNSSKIFQIGIEQQTTISPMKQIYKAFVKKQYKKSIRNILRYSQIRIDKMNDILYLMKLELSILYQSNMGMLQLILIIINQLMKNFNLTLTRLQKQQDKLSKNPIKNAVVKRQGVLNFHFCLYNLDGDYKNGFYHGILMLPEDYPFSPPKLRFFTPNGRFQINTDICTTFTNFHKQTWSTAWNIQSMVIATISFMQSNDPTTGAINQSSSEKRKLAENSLSWNMKNEQFNKLFKLSDFDIETPINVAQKQQKKIKQQQENKSSLLMIALIALFALYIFIKMT